MLWIWGTSMVAGILLVMVMVDTFLTGWLLSQHFAMRKVIQGLGQTVEAVSQTQTEIIGVIAGESGNE